MTCPNNERVYFVQIINVMFSINMISNSNSELRGTAFENKKDKKRASVKKNNSASSRGPIFSA